MGIRITVICLLLYSGYAGAQMRDRDSLPPPAGEIPASRFETAVAVIKEFEGWHSAEHYPYVGYGHRLLPGERLSAHMTKAQADSLLRADLRKLYKMCRRFGKDALLIATLAYNVGYYRLVGYGKIPKSSLIQKLEAGDRDIYREYISFRCYKGKVVPSIERRRKKEFRLLYVP